MGVDRHKFFLRQVYVFVNAKPNIPTPCRASLFKHIRVPWRRLLPMAELAQIGKHEILA